MVEEDWLVEIHTAWANSSMGFGYARFDTEAEARAWAKPLRVFEGMEVFLRQSKENGLGVKL